MGRFNKGSLVCFIGLAISICSAHADLPAEKQRFQLRLNPLLIAIGGNLDFDVKVTPQWTIGPSLFGWGGCGTRTQEVASREGNECNSWIAYGFRANYYFPDDSAIRGVYIGSGVYQVEKKSAYGFDGGVLNGQIKGTAATALLGYQYEVNSWFNVSAGAGTLVFLEKPSDLIVSNDSRQTTISSGPSTEFHAELSVGFMF